MVVRSVRVPPPPPVSSGKGAATPGEWQTMELPLAPAGQPGDLWRCDDCRKLWRHALDKPPRFGFRPLGAEWEPATWWQQLTHPDCGTRGDGYPAPVVRADELPTVPAGPAPGSGQQRAPGCVPLPPRPAVSPATPPPSGSGT